MSDDVVFTVRSGAPPVGLTAEQVADDLGWPVDRLWDAIRAGSLPSPDWFRGRALFPRAYALGVRCNGLSIPGTYPVIYFPMSATKSRARRKGKRKVGGRKPQKEQGETAAAKPAKKGGGK